MFNIRSLSGAIVLIATATLVPVSRVGAVDEGVYDAAGKYAGAYLCIPEAAGGVRFEAQSKQWMGAIFNTDKGTFVLQVAKQDDTTINMYGTVEGATAYRVTLRKPGVRASQWCQPLEPILGMVDDAHAKSVFINSGDFSCSPGFENYQFNLDKLRFVTVADEGYVNGQDNEQTGTPSITVGKCTKID
ncbi:hypothetical protein [Mesorhizobium sp. dw_380]|uniref:hypothetical protein n=1 Tax=Mesorhizobium sp. dw_380 TaxID=2812001 RepID=UPI001BDE17A6|nr:hypothetical protein [Mesorhizobium sp. dw_380]